MAFRSLKEVNETRLDEMADNNPAFVEHVEIDQLMALHEDGGKVFVIFASLMMVAFIIGHLLHMRRIKWIPESLVVVALGAVVGFMLPTGDSQLGKFHMSSITIEEESLINEMILNFVLLPIIIFEAGWSMNHKDFISQLPYILLFAIFGTLISMAVVGTLILLLSDFTHIYNWRTAFCYAALISAVDPVATLATYAHLRVDPLLNTLVFGESVINDAVAIVLFKVLNDAPVKDFQEKTASDLAGDLVSGVGGLLFCSVALGLGLGVLFILTLRFTKMGQTDAMVILYIFFSCFFTYNFTEAVCHMSGIIAVLFCGMLMGGYATPHLSINGTMLCSFLLKQSSNIADMVVFMFVGVSVVYAKPDRGLFLGLWVSLFCLIGRLVSTVPLGLLSNFIKNKALKKRPEERRHLLTWKHMLMMWHAGLRGGIALVLTLELGPWVDEVEKNPHTRDHLRNCTVVVIVLFLLVFGGSTAFSLQLLEIPTGGEGKIYHHDGRVKSFYKKARDRAIKILVGKKKKEESKQQRQKQNYLDALIQQAKNHEKPKGQQPQQMIRAPTGTFSLFGTQDPAHSKEVGRHRLIAARSSEAVSDLGAVSESDEQEEDSDTSLMDSSSSNSEDDAGGQSGSDEERPRSAGGSLQGSPPRPPRQSLQVTFKTPSSGAVDG